MSALDDNAQKTPLAQSLQKLSGAKARDAVNALGRGLPCTVAAVVSPGVVTVNFAVQLEKQTLPQITMPVNKPQYIKYPITVGDIGVALPAGLVTGGLTGLGAGTPRLNDVTGNLSALTFFWLGKSDETFIQADALELHGNILVKPGGLGFFGHTTVSKQTITGALSAVMDPAAKSVLTSIIAALTAYNLTTDGAT